MEGTTCEDLGVDERKIIKRILEK